MLAEERIREGGDVGIRGEIGASVRVWVSLSRPYCTGRFTTASSPAIEGVGTSGSSVCTSEDMTGLDTTMVVWDMDDRVGRRTAGLVLISLLGASITGAVDGNTSRVVGVGVGGVGDGDRGVVGLGATELVDVGGEVVTFDTGGALASLSITLVADTVLVSRVSSSC